MSADHAAEARKLLTIPNLGAEAVAHAVLALVEQQRIANLVSYLAIVETRGGYDPATTALEETVREGLGL